MVIENGSIRGGNCRLTKAFWFIICLATGGLAMAVEEAEYALVYQEEMFELREYAPHIIAETQVTGGFEDAGNEAFGRLFRYISGNNEAQQKVAMTSPVGQIAESQKIAMTSPVGQEQQGDKWAVSFMMPASFTLETTPIPKDPAIVIRQVPARYIAAVRYSGFWSERAYRRNLAELQSWVSARGYSVVGEPIWARYNPPFLPWFLRRNEILIPIEAPE